MVEQRIYRVAEIDSGRRCLLYFVRFSHFWTAREASLMS
jgi:hypothetical protein